MRLGGRYRALRFLGPRTYFSGQAGELTLGVHGRTFEEEGLVKGPKLALNHTLRQEEITLPKPPRGSEVVGEEDEHEAEQYDVVRHWVAMLPVHSLWAGDCALEAKLGPRFEDFYDQAEATREGGTIE